MQLSPYPSVSLFDNWITRKGWTLKKTARFLGVKSPSTVRMLRAGELSPGLMLACRIERLTGIPANGWCAE